MLPVWILAFRPRSEIERPILLILYSNLEHIVVKIGERLQNRGQLLSSTTSGRDQTGWD